eukprot:5407985-Karenia_brevis.AAC.1
MFSEVARGFPGYSRKFDGTKSERIPAYFKEYLGWLRVQMPESSSGSRDMPRRTRKNGLPEKKDRPCAD